ncbi:hypothetical protein [Spirosoma koreense]
MSEVDFHDAEIIGIESKPEVSQLLLSANLPKRGKYQIDFQEVDWWDLGPFAVQNVVFSITSFDKFSLTEVVIDHQELDEYYVELIREKDYTLFVLDASVGLEGVVIAKAMNVSPISEK